MALVIAVILGIVLLCIKCTGNISKAEYNRKVEKWKSGIETFRKTYTDESLEAAIRSCFDDVSKLDKLRIEIDTSIQEMPAWKNRKLILHICDFTYKNKYTKKEFLMQSERMNEDKKVALDILLANRGKVSIRAARDGYRSYVYKENNSDTRNLAIMQYELVEWISDTLQKQGISLEPVFVNNIGITFYGWLGSQAAPDPPFASEMERRSFSRDIITFPALLDISEPFYKK